MDIGVSSYSNSEKNIFKTSTLNKDNEINVVGYFIISSNALIAAASRDLSTSSVQRIL